MDSHREESPLRQAEDAIVIDNTLLTRKEQLEKAYQLAVDRKSLRGKAEGERHKE
jgi:cytidylate kinase